MNRRPTLAWMTDYEPYSLAWHEAKLAALPRWRLLARLQQHIATEMARERCLAAVEEIRRRVLGGSDR